MKTLFKTTHTNISLANVTLALKSLANISLGTLALLSVSTSAHAFTIETPLMDIVPVMQGTALNTAPADTRRIPLFTANTKIGIARLDGGHLIVAPMDEMRDWKYMDIRSTQNFSLISPASIIKNIPEVPSNGRDSDNKLDEIRMTAADLRMDYVIVYGLGMDAKTGEFVGKSIQETGLTSPKDSRSPSGVSKALLVNTYSGQIYGTVITQDKEFGIADLAFKMQAFVADLGSASYNVKA